MGTLKLAVSISIFTLLSVHLIQATPPPDMIVAPIKQVVDILRNHNYPKSGNKELQWQKINKVIRNNSDFTRFSRQTLGKYWRNFTPKQKREFTAAFSEFLECKYIPKLFFKQIFIVFVFILFPPNNCFFI